MTAEVVMSRVCVAVASTIEHVLAVEGYPPLSAWLSRRPPPILLDPEIQPSRHSRSAQQLCGCACSTAGHPSSTWTGSEETSWSTLLHSTATAAPVCSDSSQVFTCLQSVTATKRQASCGDDKRVGGDKSEEEQDRADNDWCCRG